MGKIKDFATKYAPKILAIYPGISVHGGMGWGIINADAEILGGIKNKPFIDECGLLTPFAADSRLTTREELCDKMITIWQNNAGFTREPLLLIIEKPLIYPSLLVQHSTITELVEFVGMLLRSFHPKLKFSAKRNEWSGTDSKDVTKEKIISILDSYSKKKLDRDLAKIMESKRHNVFYALGLGLYGGKILNGNYPLPNDNHKSRDC